MGIFDDIRSGLGGAIARFGDTLANGSDVEIEKMRKAMQDAGLAATGPDLPEATEEKPRAMYHDPYSLTDWGGWRERPSNLTYETLRAMGVSNTVIAAILSLRADQVGQFTRPQQGRFDRGFKIVKRDRRSRKQSLTPIEQKRANEIERMLETTGLLLPNEKPSDRDSFTTFIKKGVRDILTYDQWCHPKGTLIQMADGRLLPIEEVRPGNKVVTHLGRVRTVTEHIVRQYSGKMHRIHYDGVFIEATSKHPLLVDAGSGQRPLQFRTWQDAENVQPGMFLTVPKIEALGHSEELLPAMARVLGYYVAVGYRSGDTAVFAMRTNDLRTAKTIEEALGSVTVAPGHHHNGYRVCAAHQGAWFAQLCGEPGTTRRVPEAVLKGTAEVRRAFLAGYLEASASLHVQSAVATVSSLDLRGGLTLLAGMEGMHIHWAPCVNPSLLPVTYWEGTLSGPEYKLLAAEMDLPVVKTDSPATNFYADGYHYVPVSRVETYDAHNIIVHNLEVEEDHSYLANGIVSHNCFEKIRDRRGLVSRFQALPSETIRPAVNDAEHLGPEEHRSRVAYVQVYEDSVIAEFTQDDLAWCIKNPRSDLRVNGFGYSPIEQLMRLVTAWLYGFEYNQRFFSQGSAIKGILNIKGAIPDKQLRSFRRMWYSQVTGVTNAWRTPILNSDDIQWQSLHSTNREMEFGAWMDWLTKLTCAIFGVDPIEINFQFGNTGQSSSLNEGNQEAKLSESKDKGLRPLMDHITENLNRHVIWEIEPDFEFAFVGLSGQDEDKEREARVKEVQNYRTIDEIRADDDYDPLPDGKGELILNPTYLQFIQAKQAQAQQEQQMAMQGGPTGPDGMPATDQLQGQNDDSEGAPEEPSNEQTSPPEDRLQLSLRDLDGLMKGTRRRVENRRLIIEVGDLAKEDNLGEDGEQ